MSRRTKILLVIAGAILLLGLALWPVRIHMTLPLPSKTPTTVVDSSRK